MARPYIWYWRERNNNPWEPWEDETLRRLWPNEKDADIIRAALKPGRRRGTIQAHAEKLGIHSSVKRPGAWSHKGLGRNERAPTDRDLTLVYDFLGRVPKGEPFGSEFAQEIHEESGRIWTGPQGNYQEYLVKLNVEECPFQCISAFPSGREAQLYVLRLLPDRVFPLSPTVLNQLLALREGQRLTDS